MMKLAIGTLVLAAALGSSALGAEFKAQVDYTEQSSSQTMQVWVKGDRYRIERRADGQPAVVLVDRGRGVIDLLSGSDKTYHESSTSNPLAALYDPFSIIDAYAEMSGGPKKALGTETVNGHVCDKYEITTQDGSAALVDYWIARDLGFPVKIVVPIQGGMTLNVRDVQPVQIDDAVFKIPAGYAFVPEPGTTPPPWAKDVAGAPEVTVPFARVLSAGQIVRLRVVTGETVQVIGSQSAVKHTQVTAIPFSGGKPVDNAMTGTYNFGPGEKWTITLGPASAPKEIVVRVNTGRALITIRRKP